MIHIIKESNTYPTVKSAKWNDERETGSVTFILGKVSPGKYYNYGKRCCQVELDVEITDRNGEPEFTVMGTIWNSRGTNIYSAGQIMCELHDPDEYYKQFNPKSQKLLDVVFRLWQNYHLDYKRNIPEDAWEEILHVVRDKFDLA